MQSTEREDLISMAEAASYIGVSWQTLRKRRKQWGIRAYIIGGRPKFKISELDEWRDKQVA